MKIRIKFLFFHLLLYCSTVGHTQKLFYYRDTTGKLNIEQIKQRSIQWIPITDRVLDFGFVKKDLIWLRVEYPKILKGNVITIPNANLDSVTFFSNGHIYQTGDRVYNPAFFYTFPVYEITDTVTYIRVQKILSTLKIPISIKPKNDFQKSQNLYLNIDLLLLGILVAFWIFTLTMFFFSKTKTFLFLCFYITTTILYFYASNGILKSTFFPDFLYFSEFRLIISCIAPLSLFWFNRSLITYETKFVKLISSFLWKSILIMVFSSIFFADIIIENFLQLYIGIIYLLDFLLILVLFYLNIRELFNNSKSSKKRYAYIFLGSIIITLLLYLLESLKVNWLPDFDILLIITCTEITIFGMLISIDFFKKFSDNEQYALNLLESKKRALNELKSIQFKERSAIAAILHNRYQSKLTGFRLHISNMESPNIFIVEELKLLEQEIRDFSHQILPRELENGLFHNALMRQIYFLKTIYPEWNINYSIYDTEEKLKNEWSYDLYLIVTELLQNSLKHSEGNVIEIEFFRYEKECILTYNDKGKEIDSTVLDKGFGMSLIKDQVEHMGGSIHFELSPNLFIIITIPK